MKAIDIHFSILMLLLVGILIICIVLYRYLGRLVAQFEKRANAGKVNQMKTSNHQWEETVWGVRCSKCGFYRDGDQFDTGCKIGIQSTDAGEGE